MRPVIPVNTSKSLIVVPAVLWISSMILLRFLSCNSVRHLEFNQAWKLENPMIVTKGSKGGVCVFSLQKIAIKATSTSSFIDSKREMGTSWTVKLTINDSSFE